jgi:hypothetical protein
MNFGSDAERNAWQKGYDSFVPQDAPLVRRENSPSERTFVGLQAFERLYAQLPEDLHIAAIDGWWAAWRAEKASKPSDEFGRSRRS